MVTKEQVLKLQEQDLTFSEIVELTDTKPYELLSLYESIINQKEITLPWDIEFKMRKEYLKHVIFTNITAKKIICISDSHLGSKDENIDYLRQTKHYIKKENIKYLLHGGDIGDGMVDYHRKYGKYDTQVAHILEDYLYLPNTEQYLLGGNHDARYKKKGLEILKKLEEQDHKIHGVGYYQAYFKIYDKIISLEHNSYIRKRNKLITPDYIIAGHSHKFNCKENRILLPTCSDDNPMNTEDFIPGFIVLESNKKKNNVTISVTQYKYTEHGPQKVKTKSLVQQQK